MATTVHGSIEGQFVVVSGAVDLANHTAVASVDTAITVTMPDGTTSPLQSTDLIQLVGGFDALEAGVVAGQRQVHQCHPGHTPDHQSLGGAVNPASIAALTFLVSRR
jgi:hypothetical protein